MHCIYTSVCIYITYIYINRSDPHNTDGAWVHDVCQGAWVKAPYKLIIKRAQYTYINTYIYIYRDRSGFSLIDVQNYNRLYM